MDIQELDLGLPSTPDLMTLGQIQQEFNIPYKTTHAAVRSGRLAEYPHSGRRILISRADAETYKIRYEHYKTARGKQR